MEKKSKLTLTFSSLFPLEAKREPPAAGFGDGERARISSAYEYP